MSMTEQPYKAIERTAVVGACILVVRSLIEQLYGDAERIRDWLIQYKARKIDLSHWQSSLLQSRSLDGLGLVALADMDAVPRKTALAGTASFWDVFVLCPGMHLEQKAADLNKAEYPACGAMTSGYVFRVENQATVYFLQQIGRTGQLTTASVSDHTGAKSTNSDTPAPSSLTIANLASTATLLWNFASITLIALMQDWWGLAVACLFMLARACNIFTIQRRSQPCWFGQSEPGVKGDLLILLSQDRWIRLQGLVDDLKAVTSGQWLRNPTSLEAFVSGTAMLITYLAVGLAFNMEIQAKIVLFVQLVGSAALLSAANAANDTLAMHGRRLTVRERKAYPRRRVLADELIAETGRDDWAIGMGMIPAKDERIPPGGVTM